MGGGTSPSIGFPSRSIAITSSAVSALRTDCPELIRMYSVSGRRQLMWPLKSMISALSIMSNASASCCFNSWIERSACIDGIMRAPPVEGGVGDDDDDDDDDGRARDRAR